MIIKKGLIVSISLILAILLMSCAGTQKKEVVENNDSKTTPEVVTPVEEPLNDEFVVTKEVYDKTFEDIELLIVEINSVIKKKNYTKWQSYLTNEYIDHFSDKAVLDEITRQYHALGYYSVKLRTLKDYFTYVVVGARLEARLNKIEFIDENTIDAMGLYREREGVLYSFSKIDDHWKITTR